MPGGKEMYAYLAKFWTTTDLTPDEIYAIGESEVARIRSEMERVKTETGFKGTLKEFFTSSILISNLCLSSRTVM